MAEGKECTAHAYRDDQQDQKCDEEVDDSLAELGFVVASDKLVESRRHDRRQAIGSGRLAGDVDMRDEIELVGRRGCLVVVVVEVVGCCR